MNKFVILADARSGSTSLAKLLNESSDVNLSVEPFHPNYSQWNPEEPNYSELIKDEKTMNQALDEIFGKYNAMKVLAYQLDQDIYKVMLSRKDIKIVLLQRKNLAQAALSSRIGEQTGIWHQSDMKESAYKDLKPVEISEIKKIVDYVGEINETYSTYLAKNRQDDYLHLFYEELFSEDMDTNVKKITDICQFLDFSLPPNSMIEKYMRPSKSKQNKDNLYRQIPNYKEIEKEFPGIFE